MEFLKLSWEQLAQDSIALAKKLKGKKFDEIICISRGGLVVARIFSDLLDLPIANIAITSYHDLKGEKEPRLTQPLPDTYKNEIVLLIDEVSDTGKTFLRALSYLHSLPIKKIYTLSPYIKSHTKYIPDFWQIQTDKWIIFPYEIMETKKALSKNISEKEAVKKLQEIGYTDRELESVR